MSWVHYTHFIPHQLALDKTACLYTSLHSVHCMFSHQSTRSITAWFTPVYTQYIYSFNTSLQSIQLYGFTPVYTQHYYKFSHQSTNSTAARFHTSLHSPQLYDLTPVYNSTIAWFHTSLQAAQLYVTVISHQSTSIVLQAVQLYGFTPVYTLCNC
jgi:hypothetical protein